MEAYENCKGKKHSDAFGEYDNMLPLVLGGAEELAHGEVGKFLEFTYEEDYNLIKHFCYQIYLNMKRPLIDKYFHFTNSIEKINNT